MLFSNLNLKRNDQTVTVKVNDQEIHVTQYLPITEKKNIIDMTIQKATIDGQMDEVLLDLYFNLYIVMAYTDLEFSDEDQADLGEVYDKLESNHVLDKIIGALNEDEYDVLLGYLKTSRQTVLTYRYSAANVLQTMVRDLPKNAATAAEIVEHFDPQKYQQVLSFAEAANGNRPIPVNQD